MTATSAFGPPLATLRIRSGDPAGLPVRRATASLGTGEGNDVVLDGAGVASRHAELRLRGGVWTVRDLNAPDGSWVDDEAVHGEAVLAPGSILRLGSLSLVFDPEDRWRDSPIAEPAAPSPVMFLAESRHPFWPTALFVLGICGVLAALYFLFRTT